MQEGDKHFNMLHVEKTKMVSENVMNFFFKHDELSETAAGLRRSRWIIDRWTRHTHVVGGPERFELQVALQPVPQGGLKPLGQFSHAFELRIGQQRARRLQILREGEREKNKDISLNLVTRPLYIDIHTHIQYKHTHTHTYIYIYIN